MKSDLIEKHINSPFAIGETVYLQNVDKDPKCKKKAVILSFEEGDMVLLKVPSDVLLNSKFEKKVPVSMIEKYTSNIGADPFVEQNNPSTIRDYRPLQFILTILGLHKKNSDKDSTTGFYYANFNPFVFLDSPKRYQREFIWSEENQQNLIRSIYNGFSCGSIVLRRRPISFLKKIKETSPEDACLIDVIDGKQRMLTIHKFMNDQFVDHDGNLYSELSHDAKQKFTSYRHFELIIYGEETTDIETLQAFLNLNCSSTPDVSHHVKYVVRLFNALKQI